MEFLEQVPLAPYTTFKIGGPAKFFCVAKDTSELREALKFASDHELPTLILGGGSNILISDNGFAGLVIKPELLGFEVIEETKDIVKLRIGSGEVWDKVVKQAVENNWWGIENLSHIPGTVGGFIWQNAGAYGQEASEVVESVTVFDRVSQSEREITNHESQFTYRHSLFNEEGKDRYIILETVLILRKHGQPNLSYGAVKQYFESRGIGNPTLSQMRQAIIQIRNTYFPFPTQAKNGNAGSFFRGDMIPLLEVPRLIERVAQSFGQEARTRLEQMVDRLIVKQGMKTPTGFLIELCGLKGLRFGGAQVHEVHGALILNASGQATAIDVLSLFRQVRQEVYKKVGLALHIEPELVGFSDKEIKYFFDLNE